MYKIIILVIVYSVFSAFGKNSIILIAQNPNKNDRPFELIQNGRYDEAAKLLHSILAQNDDNAEAWYGLGLIEQKLHPDSSSVEQYFEKAIDNNSRYADAYYQLGLYYTHLLEWEKAEKVLIRAVKSDTVHDRAWMKLIYVLEQQQKPDPELAAILLPNTIINHPENKQLYGIYFRSILRYAQAEKAIPVLECLYRRYSENPRYAYDLAYLYYLTGYFDKADDLLMQRKFLVDLYSRSKRYLLEAKVHFELGEDSLGLQKFWRAVHSISDNRDMKIFIDDIRYIIKDKEYVKINGDSIINFTKFFERFWKSRDPNLSTEANERIPEHYRRIYYARKNFRRYAPMMFSNELMYKMDHPYKLSALKLGDEFMEGLLPEPARLNPEVDDMGIIYIRLGTPDKKIFYQCETCDENMTWLYFAENDRSQMIFNFFKKGGYRGWIIETVPHHFENRWELGKIYNQLDPTISTTGEPPNLFENIMQFSDLETQNSRSIETAMNIERTEYKYDRAQLPIPMKILQYRTDDGKILVELYYALSGQIVVLENNYLYLRKFLGVYNSTWDEILNIKKRERIPLGIPPALWQESMAVRMERFPIEPERHFYEFQIEDLRSNRLFVYKDTLNPKSLTTKKIQLSDLLMSGEIKSDQKNTFYRKRNVVYQPHMFTSFKENEILGLYFEIYNLLLNADDQTEYEVTWNIKQVSLSGNFLSRLFRGKSEEIESTNSYTGQTRDDYIYFNIALSDKSSGDYELSVTVQDKLSGMEDKRVEHFTIK